MPRDGAARLLWRLEQIAEAPAPSQPTLGGGEGWGEVGDHAYGSASALDRALERRHRIAHRLAAEPELGSDEISDAIAAGRELQATLRRQPAQYNSAPQLPEINIASAAKVG